MLETIHYTVVVTFPCTIRLLLNITFYYISEVHVIGVLVFFFKSDLWLTMSLVIHRTFNNDLLRVRPVAEGRDTKMDRL